MSDKKKINSDGTKKRSFGAAFLHWLPFYLMGAPGLIYIFINNYMPLAGLQIAFKNFNFAKGMWDSPWIGFKNFEFLFKSKDAFVIVRNTLAYNIAWIFIGMFVGVGAAILLNEVQSAIAKKFYQTAILSYSVFLWLHSFVLRFHFEVAKFYILFLYQRTFLNQNVRQYCQQT